MTQKEVPLDDIISANDYQQAKDNHDNLAKLLVNAPLSLKYLARLVASAYDFQTGSVTVSGRSSLQLVKDSIKTFSNAHDSVYQISIALGRVNSNVREIINRLEEGDVDAFSYPIKQITDFAKTCSTRAAGVVNDFGTVLNNLNGADELRISLKEELTHVQSIWVAIKALFDEVATLQSNKANWSLSGSFNDHRDFAVRVGLNMVRAYLVVDGYNNVSTDHLVKYARILGLLVDNMNATAARLDQVATQCDAAKNSINDYVTKHPLDDKQIRDKLYALIHNI